MPIATAALPPPQPPIFATPLKTLIFITPLLIYAYCDYWRFRFSHAIFDSRFQPPLPRRQICRYFSRYATPASRYFAVAAAYSSARGGMPFSRCCF